MDSWLSFATIIFVTANIGSYSCDALTDMDEFPTLAGMNTQVIQSILVDETGSDIYNAITIPSRTRGLKNQTDLCLDYLGRKKCLFLKSNFACFTHPKRMKFLCPKTCGHCVKHKGYCYQSRYGCCDDGKTIALGPNQKGCSDLCFDKGGKRLCRVLRQSGACVSRPKLMRQACSHTCGFCRPCEDEVPLKCKYLGLYSVCSKRKQDAMNRCRKTCGFCGIHDLCSGHICPNGYGCQVDDQMRPKCMCNVACRESDRHSGTVCGRDGINYKSICDMKHANCGSNFPVTAKHFGICDKFSPLDRMNCSMKERNPSNCRHLAKIGMCKTNMEMMAQHCPISCGFCKVASERFDCFRSLHGCCLDGRTPCKGAEYQGCPEYPACDDRYTILCKRFTAACGTLKNEAFMKSYCPKSCQYCNHGQVPLKPV